MEELHPLTAYLRSTGQTFEAFGEIVGLSRTSLHRIISGAQKPSADSALAIVEATAGAVRLEDLIRKTTIAAE